MESEDGIIDTVGVGQLSLSRPRADNDSTDLKYSTTQIVPPSVY